ncbi:MAG: peptidase [Clostridia bacterium]|nr:peptidase [Clostridia bacterium]
MSEYRKKGNATSAFFKDKGFYIILAVSLIMVFIAGYLAFTWDVTPEENPEVNQDDTSNPGFDQTDVPSWPDDENTVSENDENTVVDNENTDTETDGSQNEVTDVSSNGEGESTDAVSINDNQTDTVVVINYIEPCIGEIIKDYSGSDPVFSETLQDWRIHQGIDFSTDTAIDVIAVADGVVEDVYTEELMGVTVVINHEDGMRSVYQSLSINPKVLKGMAVKQGDVIGKTGSTASVESTEGTHLHFAMIKNGIYCNPNEYFKDN